MYFTVRPADPGKFTQRSVIISRVLRRITESDSRTSSSRGDAGQWPVDSEATSRRPRGVATVDPEVAKQRPSTNRAVTPNSNRVLPDNKSMMLPRRIVKDNSRRRVSASAVQGKKTGRQSVLRKRAHGGCQRNTLLCDVRHEVTT